MYLVILAAVYSLKRLFYLLPRLAVPVVIVTAVLSLLNALPHFAITLPVYAQKGSLIRQTSDLVLSYCESGELVATDAFICHNLDVVGDYTLIATDQLEFRLKDWVIKTGETAGGDGSFYVLGVPDLVHQIEIDLPMSCMLDRVQATHLPVHSLWKQWQVILPNLTFTLRQVSFGTEYELVWIHPR
jgi:hypothetical protein